MVSLSLADQRGGPGSCSHLFDKLASAAATHTRYIGLGNHVSLVSPGHSSLLYGQEGLQGSDAGVRLIFLGPRSWFSSVA
jgi:hypothetical protein